LCVSCHFELADTSYIVKLRISVHCRRDKWIRHKASVTGAGRRWRWFRYRVSGQHVRVQCVDTALGDSRLGHPCVQQSATDARHISVSTSTETSLRCSPAPPI